jgi:hypothetical protein
MIMYGDLVRDLEGGNHDLLINHPGGTEENYKINLMKTRW